MTIASRTRRVRFAAFEVDFRSCELFKHGIRMKLQDQPFQILTILLERSGELVSREELRTKLWAEDTFVDFDAGLNAAVRRLRDALNDSADTPRYIETLPRHGYRFIASVEAIPETKPELNAAGEQLPSVPFTEPGRAPDIAAAGRTKLRLAWLSALVIAGGLTLAVALATTTWRSRLFSTHASAGIRSLAVLPLQNLSGDPNQDYFADGMTDALITDLAQSKSLLVISRTSAMRYKGTQKKLSEIGKELNVDAVIEGTVVRSGDRVRIDAQLIRADTDQHLWAKSYDRKISDVLSLQADVAQAIATEIELNLTSEERTRLAAKKRIVDAKVYEAYLKGRYFTNRFNGDSLKKGVEYFQEAIRLDPNYAPAYSGLADALSILGFGWGDEEDGGLKAIEAAKKAISLDDSLAEAHASLGFVLHRHMQDWAGAEKEYRRAIELNPNYAMAHHWYGTFFRAIGRPDLACEKFRLAHALDPLNSTPSVGLSRCIYEAGHFEEAIRLMKDTVEMDPNNPASRWGLGEIYERKGMFPEAIEQYQKGAEITHRNFIMVSLLSSAYAGWGKMAEAEKLHEELSRDGEDTWISAVFHARMGQKERAIHELMVDSGGKCGPGKCGPGASLFVSEWRFDPLRSDPRFQAILKLYNYPESAFKK